MPGPNATAHTYAEMGSFKEFKARFDIKKINERDESGDSFLLRAIYGDKTDTALYLIKKGIDLNMTDSDGNTALHYAAWRKNKVVFKALLKHGADIEITNKYGNSPVWTAIMESKGTDYDLLKMILKYHPVVDRKNKVGLSPLDMTIKIGYKEAENLLRKELNRRSD